MVEDSVRAADALNSAQRADPTIKGVTLFDVFSGEGVPAGRKSIAIGVRLQPIEQTFTDAEIEAIGAKIVAAVAKATGGTLRT